MLVNYNRQADNRTTEFLSKYVEKSRSWSSAHDWKSCMPHKGIKGSNPFFSAIKVAAFVYQDKGGYFVLFEQK